jgi:hypothetical protein
MSSWAHALAPTLKHPSSSEQIKQAHVPTSCGTPVMLASITTAPDAQIGLTAQVAADLLPEAWDSGTVEAEHGL